MLVKRRMTARDLADAVDMWKVNTVLEDILSFKRVKSRQVPKQFNFFEKECHIKTCGEKVSDY